MFQVATAIEDLINQHQRLPGSILMALLDRLPSFRRHQAAKTKNKDE